MSLHKYTHNIHTHTHTCTLMKRTSSIIEWGGWQILSLKDNYKTGQNCQRKQPFRCSVKLTKGIQQSKKHVFMTTAELRVRTVSLWQRFCLDLLPSNNTLIHTPTLGSVTKVIHSIKGGQNVKTSSFTALARGASLSRAFSVKVEVFIGKQTGMPEVWIAWGCSPVWGKQEN